MRRNSKTGRHGDAETRRKGRRQRDLNINIYLYGHIVDREAVAKELMPLIQKARKR